MGVSSSTIDLNRTDLGADFIAATEAAANAVVDSALPVSASFIGEVDLLRIPLRKPPKVTEDVRVVQVATYDWSACGGTHVRNTAEIELVKIVGTERRGAELRVSFLCGARARADYARLHLLVSGLASRFTVGQDDVPAAVDRLASEHRAARKELADLEVDWVESTATALLAAAERRGAWQIQSLGSWATLSSAVSAWRRRFAPDRAPVRVSLRAEGLVSGPPPVHDSGLEVRRRWFRGDGSELEPGATLRSGELVLCQVTVRRLGQHTGALHNVAIVDALPGGLEVENPRLATSAAFPLAPDPAKHSGQVTRLFRRLHAHQLIAKIPRSRRWRVSFHGRRVMATAIKLREVAYPGFHAQAA